MMISRHVHLKVAAALWGFVGVGLLIAGLCFLLGHQSVDPALSEGRNTVSLITLALAIGLGVVKWRFAITRIGQKNIARIGALPEKSPLYMTFSARSWMLIVVMIALGRLIRFLGAPSFVVGGIYTAVGTALLLGSGAYLKKRNF